jgi:4-hydroxybenzoate polyprenyltransferase
MEQSHRAAGAGEMNAVAVRAPGAWTLLKLGRVSNLPTVWTNVIAAAAITNAVATVADVAVIAVAMTAFYVGGMYLNDFFDREIDARERPGRPICAGEISAAAVSTIGFALLGVGMILLAPFGLAGLICGLTLAAAIVLYDIWHKGNFFAPVIMGLCRALVYLATGAAVGGDIRVALVASAIALAAHVIGLTYAAKQENLNQVGWLWPLAILAAPVVLALSGISNGWTVLVAILLLCTADIAAVRLLARRATPHAVPRAVSMLIAAICLVDALAVALYGGGTLLACLCASGYLLTRIFQTIIPGT